MNRYTINYFWWLNLSRMNNNKILLIPYLIFFKITDRYSNIVWSLFHIFQFFLLFWIDRIKKNIAVMESNESKSHRITNKSRLYHKPSSRCKSWRIYDPIASRFKRCMIYSIHDLSFHSLYPNTFVYHCIKKKQIIHMYIHIVSNYKLLKIAWSISIFNKKKSLPI